jgi:hypothetical protein
MLTDEQVKRLWEDTVMTDEAVFRIENKLWSEIPNFRDEQFGEFYIDVKQAIKKAQAEISYKAGMQKVVDNSEIITPPTHDYGDKPNFVLLKISKAFLKEIGG